jgi:hypothetical protein
MINMDNDLDESPDQAPPPDHVRRFTALREESLELLDHARTLVGEMREILADCRLRRPVVEVQATADTGAAAPAVRSHRGGRVVKAHRRSRIRRHPR